MAGLTPWQYAERTKSEYAEQVALFMWANMAARFGVYAANEINSYTIQGAAAQASERALWSKPVECLKYMYAIKNAGHGDAIRGAMSKAEGVKAGVPDVCLPIPARISVYNAYYHGLYIELKRLKSARGAKGVVADVQTDYHKFLTSAGYDVAVCVGWLEARDKIISYLGLASG